MPRPCGYGQQKHHIPNLWDWYRTVQYSDRHHIGLQFLKTGQFYFNCIKPIDPHSGIGDKILTANSRRVISFRAMRTRFSPAWWKHGSSRFSGCSAIMHWSFPNIGQNAPNSGFLRRNCTRSHGLMITLDLYCRRLLRPRRTGVKAKFRIHKKPQLYSILGSRVSSCQYRVSLYLVVGAQYINLNLLGSHAEDSP